MTLGAPHDRQGLHHDFGIAFESEVTTHPALEDSSLSSRVSKWELFGVTYHVVLVLRMMI